MELSVNNHANEIKKGAALAVINRGKCAASPKTSTRLLEVYQYSLRIKRMEVL